MDSIVSKVRVELDNLAALYAADKHENVTISLVSDFQRALFTILDERIRIKDLEQSKELRDEMIRLFENEYPTKPAWPYLSQLKRQDRCSATLGCIFKDGAALYRSSSCQEHFVCENHKSSPCIVQHKNVVGEKYQTKIDTRSAGNIAVNASTEHLAGEETGKRMPGNEKPAKTDTERSLLITGDLNQEKQPNPIVNETIGMVKPSQDVQYPWADDFNYYIGSPSSEESEWDDDVVNGEERNWQNIDIGA